MNIVLPKLRLDHVGAGTIEEMGNLEPTCQPISIGHVSVALPLVHVNCGGVEWVV